MGTKKTCDHCDRDDVANILPMEVTVLVDGIAVEGQKTGVVMQADICDGCREVASGKLHTAALQRTIAGAPYHRTMISKRAEAADRLSKVAEIQSTIRSRSPDSRVATDVERATIEALTTEADALEAEALAAFQEGTQVNDAIKAW